MTPLSAAILAKRCDLIKYFLGHGADPDMKLSGLHYNPLYHAALNGYIEMATILLENGANPNIKSTQAEYTTPLYRAVVNQDEHMIRILLENGANPNIKRTATGHTPLYQAVLKQDVKMARMLLENGAQEYINEIFRPFEEKNRNISKYYSTNAKTTLGLAVERGDTEMTKLLLEYGAREVIHDAIPKYLKDYSSPLVHAASRSGKYNLSKLLIYFGMQTLKNRDLFICPFPTKEEKKELYKLRLKALSNTKSHSTEFTEKSQKNNLRFDLNIGYNN